MTLLLLACAEAPATNTEHVDVTCDESITAVVEPTEIATAPRVRFVTDESVISRVVFDNGDATERRSDPDAVGTDHAHVLVGILPEVEFAFRVEVLDGSEYRCVATGTGETGPLPAGLPEWSTLSPEPDKLAPGLNLIPMITSAMPADSWLVIVDESGRAVWAWDASGEISGTLATRAWPARDRDGILFNSGATSANNPSLLARVHFDGTWEKIATPLGGHTDFVELDEGRIAYIGWEIREFENQTLLGDHVSVVDADGVLQTLWKSFDNIPIDLDTHWPTGFYMADADVGDWSHVNGINWDADSGDIFVTMSVWDGVARIDGATGEQEWLLGSGVGDFTSPTGEKVTDMPHSVAWLGQDELLVFNRTAPSSSGACSRAVDISLDTASGVSNVEGTLTGDACTVVSFLGAAERLENGNTMIDWSSAGRLDEVAPGGETLWSLRLEAGAVMGFTSRIPEN